jgi:hypothetical protein
MARSKHPILLGQKPNSQSADVREELKEAGAPEKRPKTKESGTTAQNSAPGNGAHAPGNDEVLADGQRSWHADSPNQAHSFETYMKSRDSNVVGKESSDWAWKSPGGQCPIDTNDTSVDNPPMIGKKRKRSKPEDSDEGVSSESSKPDAGEHPVCNFLHVRTSCMQFFACVDTYKQIGGYTCMRTCVHTYRHAMHPYIPAGIHIAASMHACHTRMHAYKHVYIYAKTSTRILSQTFAVHLQTTPVRNYYEYVLTYSPMRIET